MEFPMRLQLSAVPLSLAAILTLPAWGGPEPSGRSPITVHALDTSKGKPAAGLAIVLEKAEGKQWRDLAQGKTDGDGRIETLLPKGKPVAAGVYRITFATGAYFA